MSKRRGADDENSPVSSKRARIDNGSDLDNSESEHIPRSQRNKSKGKARAVSQDIDSDDDDQEVEIENDGDLDEEEFEEKYGPRIEESWAAKRSVVGGIAEYGIIEKIEMHQFMCHRYLTFNFAPQINFIIGHNGSGKSAVLSAITIVLGGKSNSTGRGSGLKSFIREGQSVSEITITLKNQGEEAYKPHEYGKSILITRRFTREGSSTWKIKGSKSNAVISTKREELSAICDHMNLQVDNPMTVLTQDAARQFLSAANKTDKYKFFLRGTLLAQLESEYESCLSTVHNTSNVLSNKKETLPDLKQALIEATARYEEVDQARKQQEKLDKLKIELVWAHVKVEEKVLQKRMEDVEKGKRQMEKIEESLEMAQEVLQRAGDEVRKHEGDVSALGEIERLVDRKKTLKEEIRGHNKRIADCTNNLKTINSSMVAAKKSIAEYEVSIAAEIARVAQDTHEKREAFTLRMSLAQNAIAETQSLVDQLASRKRENAAQSQRTKDIGQAKDTELLNLRESISETQNDIAQLQRSEDSKYAAYGAGMAKAVNMIHTSKWHGDVPLGPLGIHVKIKEPDVWADMLAQQLSAQLTAFAVTDARDRDVLKTILNSFKLYGNQIIIYEKDMFDYRSGEPPQGILTILRAMEIDNPWVERILINQSRIERLILTRSRKEGEDVLRQVGSGLAWSLDRYIIKRFPEGGGSTNYFAAPKRSQMLRNEDTSTRQRHLETELRRLKALCGPLEQEVQRLKSDFSAAKREENQLVNDDRKAHAKLAREIQAKKDLQQEADEDMSVDIQTLQQAKKESEEEKQDLIKQFEDISRLKEEYSQVHKTVEQQIDVLNVQINDFDQRKDEIEARVEAAVHARVQAQHNVRHYEAKAEETTKVVDAAEIRLTDATEKFETWTAEALKFGDPVETTRKPEDIERQRDKLKLVLQEQNNRQGAAVDDIVREVNISRQRYERAKKDIREMIILNKLLKACLKLRLERWHEFRRHIALRCKKFFQYNLSQRGYFGKALFNHLKGELELKVQTDDQLANQDASKEKDPNSLSGGEKSFSTICLLLSLWETIGCPLRCLDEFDVFMDAVNRRISMKMMIETATQSDKKQYILITPQDITNLRAGPNVHIHRMSDPERGQGILAG